MRVNIRLTTETSYVVTVDENATVEDLRAAATAGCPSHSVLPEDFKLIFNGAKLDSSNGLLSDCGMSCNETTVILMSTSDVTASASTGTSVSSSSSHRKKKKSKCSFQLCSSTPLRIVGACSHCSGNFCAKHRLLEDHLCIALQRCKDAAHEKNAMKLQSESTLRSQVARV
ncbi:uncharacterized protein KQ657_002636 [Scheffersomyces spartinae]|uniref:AN1-type domain-containing protein n=1 Tax=Scheffersomyces spartinae TaxID=45513 RepID=A0A9P8AH16_9ASCO|nr:uncharacterized protein KQ657_002636 [Scheffersomyces spartinae]KAG7192026.1 hypothetical protein KQ657_002636 [Scheffersomyces spartinae]